MRIEVVNVLGIDEVSVEFEPGQIVAIAGRNATGKTSFATAAQAVLAREVNPLGVPAAQSSRIYVREGEDGAQADFIVDGTVITWRPQQGTIDAPNDGPICSPEAVGLIDYTARAGGKERASRLQSALLPPYDELASQARVELTRYLVEKDVQGCLEMIQQRGWEAASAVYADRARAAKGQWTDVTGRHWGARLAQDWRPDGWLADWDHLSKQQAEERVVAARNAVSALHEVRAISEAEAAEAQKARDELPALEKAVDAAAAELERHEKAVADREAELKLANEKVTRLERDYAQAKKSQECPHCKQPLRIIKGKLEVDDDWHTNKSLPAQLGTAKKSRDKAINAQAEAVKEATPFREKFNEAKAKYNLATQAGAKSEGTVTSEDHAGAIAAAEDDVQRAQDVVSAVESVRRADELHGTIMRYASVSKAIGPEGVRSRMLQSSITRLNLGLAAICDTTEWPEMLVDEKGNMSWDARPIQSCSESERWRAQAAMQLTLAALTNSPVVVLDRADVLDKAQRKAMGAALQHVAAKTQIAIIVCGTQERGEAETWGTDWNVFVQMSGA